MQRGSWIPIRNAEGRIIGRQRLGGEIEWVEPGHPKWLEWETPGEEVNAGINWGSGRYYFRRDARKIEVLEEWIHNVPQRKIGGRLTEYPYDEIHVKDFMIRHRKMLGLSDEDVNTLQKMLGRDCKRWRIDPPASVGEEP